MRIVGYYVSNNCVANSDGEYTTTPPYLDFILAKKPDSIKIMYNLGYNVANLIRLARLNVTQLKELYTNHRIYATPYKIKYIHGKFLELGKGFYSGAPFGFYYDARQYKDLPLIDGLTTEECIEAAKKAKEVGELVYNSMTSLKLNTRTLTSPVRVFEQEVLNLMDLPNVDDIPEIAGYFAYECCKGNWVEAYQLGHWEKVWDYDIQSAYPSEISQLVDIRLGTWFNDKRFIEQAYYGYCKCKVTINKEINFSPIILKIENNEKIPATYTPTGTWETYLTKREIEFIIRNKLGSVEIEDGWWWVADAEKIEKPLEGIINWLYEEKQKENGIRREVIKRIMAGIYGKFLEIDDNHIGNYVNPVWAAEIETNTRLEVGDFILRATQQINAKPIHVAVDGVILDRPFPQLECDHIGTWKLNNISPCICTGTGNVALIDNGVGDFHLHYNWLKDAIDKEPEEKEYKMNKISSVTLPVAINERRISDIGKLYEAHKSVYIEGDKKRCYRNYPKCGKDILENKYESLPWDRSLITK